MIIQIDNNNFEKLFKGKDDSAFPYDTKSLMKHNDCFDMDSDSSRNEIMILQWKI